MIPRQKAALLILTYMAIVVERELAKKCALAAVDEIIASNTFEQNHQDYIHPFIADKNGYWREVKQEIEKL